MPTNELNLKDKGRGRVLLTIRDGVVVGAIGSEPARFLGLTESGARHLARYGGIAKACRSLGDRLVSGWICDGVHAAPRCDSATCWHIPGPIYPEEK